MKTSERWWAETRDEPGRLLAWLRKQYHGEVTAVERIRTFADRFAQGTEHAGTLATIAAQEADHAAWVGELLAARGEAPARLTKPERYWDETLPGIDGLERGAATAAHAERMRLERIRVIAADPQAPADVRAVFQRILPQEEFHEQAFAAMAGAPALAEALDAHRRGRAAIGLVPEE